MKFKLLPILALLASLNISPGQTAGRVIAWGNDVTNVPSELTNVLAIAAPGNGVEYDGYALALKSDGTVLGWGSFYTPYYKFVTPPNLNNVKAIAAGTYHAAALKNDGTVVAWGGNNSYGQTNVPDGLQAIAIAAGYEFTLALRSNHTVTAWGRNSYSNCDVPVGLTNAVAVSAGMYHGLALKSDGKVVGWGDNTYGQTAIPLGLSNVLAIAAGPFHNLALRSNGTVVAWGYNGSQATNVTPGLSNVVAIAAGKGCSLALKSNGTMQGWGKATPIDLLPAETNVTAIALGSLYFGLAITVDLKINQLSWTNQVAVLNFHTFSGQQYSVEYSSNLMQSNWVNLPGGNLYGNGFDTNIFDRAITTEPSRFYRIKLLP